MSKRSGRKPAMRKAMKTQRQGKPKSKERIHAKDALKLPRTNRPPKGKTDFFDVPLPEGVPFMVPVDIPASAASAGASGSGGGPNKGSKSKRRRENVLSSRDAAASSGRGAGSRASLEKSRGDAASRASKEDHAGDSEGKAKPKPPQQKPGETVGAYKRRVDAWAEDQLKEVSGKAPTEHMRGKKRKRREEKKAKQIEKKKDEAKDDDDGLHRPAERVKFGDVVQRPPILGSDAMKSRAKLKRLGDGLIGKSVGCGLGDGVAGVSTSHIATSCKTTSDGDMAAYAAKVRDAYAEMKKKKRLAKEQGQT
eukprot:TRINITY_DN24845_c0_g1_i1.p1 TRINITY_DN24845_c0_g1~~TRINITY_DN24845_c0_g1_i1.p1  ORF type:complete len:308 (-),score=76.53 TRINITY_DN24845_c0_g1_i1:95-1018(-)